MSKDEIIAIKYATVDWELSKEEMFHILKELDGYLEFDYGALENGNPGHHFELKSGIHSDSFIDSSTVLQYENLRRIIARQLVNKYQRVDKVTANLNWDSPNCVAGIPNGAKLLGENVSDIFKARKMDLIKQDGNIVMNSVLKLNDTLLFVEDICTKGTALNESVNALYEGNSSGTVVPFVLTIVNRGGLNQIQTNKGFVFDIVSLYSVNSFNEWDKDDCELCRMGSESIKPKEMRENNLAMR